MPIDPNSTAYDISIMQVGGAVHVPTARVYTPQDVNAVACALLAPYVFLASDGGTEWCAVVLCKTSTNVTPHSVIRASDVKAAWDAVPATKDAQAVVTRLIAWPVQPCQCHGDCDGECQERQRREKTAFVRAAKRIQRFCELHLAKQLEPACLPAN